jgi:hypothetical protein
MKRHFFKKLAVAIAIAYLPLQTMAWGTNGHRISGQIAEDHLTLKARTAVKFILGTESIAMASTWGDFIKSDSNYKDFYSWHYIDLERVYSFPELVEFVQHDNNVDLYTRINFLAAELKKKTTTKANKLVYLKMLIHLAEDMHQPLHTTGHEQGGNGVKLRWMSKETNLHTVWDSELINFQELSYTEYVTAIDHATPAQIKKWQAESINQWLYESHVLAEKIYNDAKPGEILSYNYNFKYIATVNQQLLKGGIRLAGLLNQIFG